MVMKKTRYLFILINFTSYSSCSSNQESETMSFYTKSESFEDINCTNEEYFVRFQNSKEDLKNILIERLLSKADYIVHRINIITVQKSRESAIYQQNNLKNGYNIPAESKETISDRAFYYKKLFNDCLLELNQIMERLEKTLKGEGKSYIKEKMTQIYEETDIVQAHFNLLQSRELHLLN